MHTGDSHVRTLWADRECPVCFWLACTCVDVNLSRRLFTWLIAASTMMYYLRQLDISGDDDSNHSRHPGRWLVVNVSRTIYGTTFSSSRSIISISNLYVILKSRTFNLHFYIHKIYSHVFRPSPMSLFHLFKLFRLFSVFSVVIILLISFLFFHGRSTCFSVPFFHVFFFSSVCFSIPFSYVPPRVSSRLVFFFYSICLFNIPFFHFSYY